MSILGRVSPEIPPEPPPAQPLESGDQLSRAEFERRYEAMPHVKKAELIEGVVYMPSPVRLDQHGSQHFDLITWLGNYRAYTPGVRGGDNTTIRLDMDNEPQPDGALIVEPAYGGRVRLDAEGYIVGGPELIGEVSASSASIDLNRKFHVYRRNEVLEYVVWRVLDREIDWFTWREGRYDRLPRDAAGIYRSALFPGLWLDAAALVRQDMPSVLRVLQEGIKRAEHAAFVARLQNEAARPAAPQ